MKRTKIVQLWCLFLTLTIMYTSIINACCWGSNSSVASKEQPKDPRLAMFPKGNYDYSWPEIFEIEQVLQTYQSPNFVNSEGEALIHKVCQHSFRTKEYPVLVLRLLLKYKADVTLKTPRGETALSLATEKGLQFIIDPLLASGANPIEPNQSGRTPVHIAAANGHLLALQSFFAKAGSEEQQKLYAQHCDGVDYSPLHYGISAKNSHPIVAMLLAYGANPNAKDFEDDTPVHALVRYYPSKINSSKEQSVVQADALAALQCLLDNDADPEKLNKETLKPIDYVRKEKFPGNDEFIKLLTVKKAEEAVLGSVVKKVLHDKQ